MQKDKYDRIIGFLQGASWAFVLFGAFFIFKFSILFGFSFALFSSLVFIIFSLFLILFLDAFNVNKRRLEEAKKQTELLEKIYEREETK